jgi:acylphosphatase
MKVRVHILISGIVQGVFFRSSIRRIAVEIGLFGWVRNLENGRVEAVLEGEEKKVEIMIDFCKKGPPGSDVVEAEINWEPYSGIFSNFSIYY